MVKKSIVLSVFIVLFFLSSFSFVLAEEQNFFEKLKYSFNNFFFRLTGFVVSDDVEISSENNSLLISEEVEEIIVPPLPPEPKEVSEENEVVNKSTEFAIEGNLTILKKEDIRSKVIIGRPVKNIRKIVVEGEGSLEVELPKVAENIVVKTGESARKAEEEIKEFNEIVEKGETEAISLISGNVVKGSDLSGNSFLEKILKFFFKGITGKVIYENALEISVEENSLKVDLSDVVSEKEIVIEYETPGPQISEEVIGGWKKVVVYDENDMGYEDILVFTKIDENISRKNKNKFKIIWVTENNKSVKFNSKDRDNNTLIDYFEWNVPHLSEQEFIIMGGCEGDPPWSNGCNCSLDNECISENCDDENYICVGCDNDNTCEYEYGENCESCSTDCGSCYYCGDGWCGYGENCDNCPDDCGPCSYCGDGWCGYGESCYTCPNDCGSCGLFCNTPLQWGGNTYLLNCTPSNWTNAKAFCNSMGGWLVTINNWSEEEYLESLLFDSTWIGFNDRENEGTWVWDSGQPVNFTNWEKICSQEPNNFIDEDCGTLNHPNHCGNTGAHWNDLSCDASLPFICEFECQINLQNTSWSEWYNISGCNENNSVYQGRNLTQYDANECPNYENITFYEYRWVGCSNDAFCGGSGTEEDPYLICDWHNLNNIRLNLFAHYALNNSLNKNTFGYSEFASSSANGGLGFEPIGNISNRFNGSFNGRNYIIDGLYINRLEENYVGLFGYVENGGNISNIGLVNLNVSGYSDVGGLAGVNGGTISNSYSTGSVSGDDYVGGLAGWNHYGTISNSFWDVNSSGRENGCGSGSCSGVIGKTTQEMKVITTFSSVGWNILGSLVNLNNGYPYLGWQANNESIWLIYNNPFDLNSCGVLSEPGVYTLQRDIEDVIGTCFNITANNVTLNLNGFTIRGNNQTYGRGVYAGYVRNVRVLNGNINGFQATGGEGIRFENVNNSLIEGVVLSDLNTSGVVLSSSFNNTLRNLSLSSARLNSILLSDSNNNLFSNISIGQNFSENGISFNRSSNNLFVNPSFYNSLWAGEKIFYSENWGFSNNNRLVYNNSHGEIRFVLAKDISFAEGVFGGIALGKTLNISIGVINLSDGVVSALNGTANVSFFNATLTGFPSYLLRIGLAGKICNLSVCVNSTRLNVLPARFSVPYLAKNITLGMLSEYFVEIPLKKGWNLISFSDPSINRLINDCDIETTADGLPSLRNCEVELKDVEIPLKKGWNLIGYSSPLDEAENNLGVPQPLSFGNISRVKNNNQNLRWDNAASQKIVNRYIVYYRNDENMKGYDFIGIPKRSNNMGEGRGYWIYSYEDNINLTLKDVIPEGAQQKKSFQIRNLMFRNDSSGEIRNITQAVEPPAGHNWTTNGNVYRGWFGSCNGTWVFPPGIWHTNCMATQIYWWDPTISDFRTRNYPFTDSIYANVSAWNGYFIYMNFPNISVLIME